jgi:ATP-binding cassette subfamily B protein
MKELSRLNHYLLFYKWHLLLGTFFVMCSSIFAIIPAQIVRYAFDIVSNSIDIFVLFDDFELQNLLYDEFKDAVLIYGALIVLMALIRGVFLFFMRQTIIVMSRLIEFRLKNDIYKHYQSLPLSFYRQNNTGDLMARISEDVGHVRMYLGPAIMYSINTIGTFILVVSYMLTINPKLTFFALLPLPILSLCVYFISQMVNTRSMDLQTNLSELTSFVQESFSGIRVIKAFVREKDMNAQLVQKAEVYKDKSMNLIKINAFFMPAMLVLIGLSTVLTVYVGGIEVMAGTITAGNIAEFIIYVTMLAWPVISLGWVTSIIQRAAASQKRINEFMDVKNDILSTQNIERDIKGKIAFKNVSFTYPDSGIVALDNISFNVDEGETLAILGTTGSGKSTVANLICRMYDPSKGEILIDELDSKAYQVGSLRGQIGYVPQDVFLFSDTIRNNIAFGFNKGEIKEEQIIQAAKDADLLENIKTFPKGFETELGERGVTLSGGQKQRASIARAIIGSPSILILDDSLSAVDTKTENIILDNLARIMKNRTSIIISHRVSSVKLANKIIVLDEGKIVEQGTHKSLMEHEGMYKDLYQKQLRQEEETA